MRYTRDVGPGDSGVRITLRRTLPEGGLGDVLGELLSWENDLVRVRRKDGVVVEVPASTVVAAKKIPPAPIPRR